MRRSPDPEAGAVTGSIAVMMLIAAIVFGVVLDIGGVMRTQQRAEEAASEAARAAGQALNVAAAANGTATEVDPAAAVTAAQTYLAAAGITGTVSAAGSTIAVTTSTTYEAHLLGFTRTVTGHAEARIARSVEGTEQ